VPEETIRRRYHAGIRNFFKLYRPMADTWFFFMTTQEAGIQDCWLMVKKKKSLLVNDPSFGILLEIYMTIKVKT